MTAKHNILLLQLLLFPTDGLTRQTLYPCIARASFMDKMSKMRSTAYHYGVEKLQKNHSSFQGQMYCEHASTDTISKLHVN